MCNKRFTMLFASQHTECKRQLVPHQLKTLTLRHLSQSKFVQFIQLVGNTVSPTASSFFIYFHFPLLYHLYILFSPIVPIWLQSFYSFSGLALLQLRKISNPDFKSEACRTVWKWFRRINAVSFSEHSRQFGLGRFVVANYKRQPPSTSWLLWVKTRLRMQNQQTNIPRNVRSSSMCYGQ